MYPESFNLENHKEMQKAPATAALATGLGGGALGALFAKLTGRLNPLLGLGIGAGVGGLGGYLTGASLKNVYNSKLTPEQIQYLSAQNPASGIVSPNRNTPQIADYLGLPILAEPVY